MLNMDIPWDIAWGISTLGLSSKPKQQKHSKLIRARGCPPNWIFGPCMCLLVAVGCGSCWLIDVVVVVIAVVGVSPRILQVGILA